jgi:hypothetical protein
MHGHTILAVLLLALLPAATSLGPRQQQQWQQQQPRVPAQPRTVMSWVVEPPPWNQTSHFILRGAAKGAVNIALGQIVALYC